MGKLVNLDDYRKSNELEEDYLKFLTHVNKYMKIPTNLDELSRAFYFTLRYLEGNVNCFAILSIIKSMPDDQVGELKTMVINYLDSIINDLNQY